MVVGIALDKSQDSSENKIEMTQQFVNTITASKEEAVNSYYNITNQGKSIFQLARKTSTTTDRSPYYMHMKVIVISDKLSSLNLMKLTDMLLRDHEVRRTVQVLFIRGNAKKVLETKLEKREIPSLNIFGTTKNDYKTSEMPHYMTLGNMSQYLTNGTSFLVQKINLTENGVSLHGSAVISGKKKMCIGWLNEDETSGINWILGTQKGVRGGILYMTDQKSKEPIVYEIDRIKTKIKPVIAGDHISFHVSINSEGRLSENWTSGDAFEPDFINKVNQMAEEKMSLIIRKALAKTKDHYKVDVAGFGTQLKIHDYAVWKKYKNNWDEKFSESEIDVDVKVKISGYGSRGKHTK